VDATGNSTANPNLNTPALTANTVPTCVQSNIAYAEMVSVSVDVQGVTQYQVEKCLDGYTINYNNNSCEPNVKNCTLFSTDGDCLGCDSGYKDASVYLVYGIFEKGYCQTWDELLTTEQTDLSSVYQTNCNYYQYKYNNTSNIVSMDEGSLICYQCEDGYYFATDVTPHSCSLKRTTNCMTYDVTDQTGRCTACDPGYKLVDQGMPTQECQVIINTTSRIPNCNMYNENLDCIECDSGYLLRNQVGENGQVGFCFEIYDDQNCSLPNTDVFKTTGAVQCEKCVKVQNVSYYPKKMSAAVNTCVYLSPRTNCAVHNFDTKNSLDLSNSFACSTCAPEYYLNSSVCKLRVNYPVKNCIQYQVTGDQCSFYTTTTTVVTATDEFSNEIESVQILLLTPPDTQATDNKFQSDGWILGCEIYESETECFRCFAPKYINTMGFEYNTKCATASVSIENCLSYFDSITCQECFPGYMLVDNTCQLITVENCLGYLDPNTCSSCPTNNPYIDSDGNCTVDPRNMYCELYFITNETLNLQSSQIYECDRCIEGYYPDDNSICSVVEDLVENCKYYSGDGICTECYEGFYLNYEGKYCFINPSFDTNCQDFGYLTECSVCDKGYFVSETGACQACDPEMFPERCLFCDPKDNSVCLICEFGYTQTAEGCVLDGEPEPAKKFIDPFRYFIDQNTTAQSGLLGNNVS
jgi:hypothetical protein